MAKDSNLTDFLTDVANTIRNTDGTLSTINPQTFSTRIVNYQNKTVTPSTSQQSVTRDNGYMALGTVTINAMPGGTATVQDRTSGGTAVGYGKEVNLTAGYYSAQKFYNSIEAGTIDVTDLTITPNALSGSWNSSTNKYVVSQASKTATMQSTVTAAGYVSSTVGTKNTGTATVSAPSNLEIPKATFEVSGASVKTTSSGAGYIPASTTVGTIGNGTATGNAGTITYVSHTQDSSNKKKFTVTGSVTAPAPTVSAGYVSSGTAGTATNRTVSLTITDAQAQAAVGNHSGSSYGTAGSLSISKVNVTTSSSDSSGISITPSATGVSRQYNVTTAGYIGTGVYGTADGTLSAPAQYITDITVPATKTLNSVTLTPGQTTTTLTTLTLNGTATAITNLVNYGTIGSATTTVSSVTSNNAGNIYIPHKFSGSGNVYVAPYTSGSTFTYYKIISSGALATGSATPSASYATLSSAGSSPTSVTSQYFKITPTASVGTAGWINSISNGTVQNYTVRSASVTPSATLAVSASALTSTTTVGGQYFTITPSASVGTSGWVSSINDGTAKNYQVSNHAGSAASVSGTNTFSYSTNSTWSTSNTSSGIYASAYATGVSKRYTVSTAGWISGGTYGGTDGTLSSSTYYLTGLTVASGKTLSSITNNGTLSDIINNGTISSITNNASIDYIQNTDPDGSIDIGNEGDMYIDNSGRITVGDNSNGGQIDIANQEYSFDIVSMQGNTVTLAEYSDGPTYHIVTNDDGMLTTYYGNLYATSSGSTTNCFSGTGYATSSGWVNSGSKTAYISSATLHGTASSLTLNSGTITNVKGTGTITTLGASGSSGILNITTNGYSSTYKGEINVTTNTNGTVRVGGTTASGCNFYATGNNITIPSGTTATVSTLTNSSTFGNGGIQNYTGSGTILTYTNTGTISNMTGSRTITNLGTSSATGYLTISNLGNSSSYISTLTVNENRYGRVTIRSGNLYNSSYPLYLYDRELISKSASATTSFRYLFVNTPKACHYVFSRKQYVYTTSSTRAVGTISTTGSPQYVADMSTTTQQYTTLCLLFNGYITSSQTLSLVFSSSTTYSSSSAYTQSITIPANCNGVLFRIIRRNSEYQDIYPTFFY